MIITNKLNLSDLNLQITQTLILSPISEKLVKWMFKKNELSSHIDNDKLSNILSEKFGISINSEKHATKLVSGDFFIVITVHEPDSSKWTKDTSMTFTKVFVN